MDIFTFIFLVVVVSCSIPLLKVWMEGRNKQMGNVASDSVRKELAALRERVEVLEKIVTDKSYEVRREIDALENS